MADEGFKKLIKRKPSKGMEVPCGSNDKEYDSRPQFYLNAEDLPADMLKECKVGERYVVEVEMSSKTMREKQVSGEDDEQTAEGSFTVIAIKPA